MTDTDERREADTPTSASDPTEWDEIVALVERKRREDAARYEEMRLSARAAYRAVEGWGSVRSEADWIQVCETAAESYQSGRFLIDRLGAERHLDPELMAVLWHLRQDILDGLGTVSSAEAMLVDMAVLGYYHTLRINGWIGSFAASIEHEFFGQEPPALKYRYKRDWHPDGMKVEDYLHRVGEELLPLMDRANRLMIRNLKAIQDMRRATSPAVAIHRAGQVNLAQQQVNLAADHPSGADE